VRYDVFGLGNALVDALVVLDEQDILVRHGLRRGTMHLVDDPVWQAVYGEVPRADVVLAPGGSCANTVSTVALLGGAATFCGLVGQDELGDSYDDGLSDVLGQHYLVRRAGSPTGKCLSLVSNEDAERTMLTDLGTSMALEPSDVPVAEVCESQWFHVTGYLFTGGRMGDAAMDALAKAHAEGTKISFDLGDTFVIKHFGDAVNKVIDDYASLVFMNREEGRALLGGDPEELLGDLSARVSVVVLKLGSEGSLVRCGDETLRISARRVEAVDTTGAGDSYAGGFLYGMAKGWDLSDCGKLASEVAALTVSQLGGVVRDRALLAAVLEAVAPVVMAPEAGAAGVRDSARTVPHRS
jgi:sugar/nucleoside kinase (ribokinase family)